MGGAIAMFTPDDQARWDKKVRKDSDGCWRWTGGKNRKGYGLFRMGSNVHLAHRVAYVQAHGPIPEGQLIRHLCPGTHTIETRACVNPSHLAPGTDADNGADKAACGSMKGKCAGERNGRCKLSDAQVEELRRRIDAGECRVDLAREFGISVGYLYEIKKGSNRSDSPARKPRRSRNELYKDTELVLTELDIARFWRFVDKSGDCWLWTGCTESGYGAFNVGNRVRAAHRMSILVHGGKLEKGLDVAHECAEKLCVRPDHLKLRTRRSNMQNEETRRRLSDAHKGNRNRRILSDDQIRWIKERFRDEPLVSAAQLARELGGIVTPECIANVRKGKTGKHVPVDGFVETTLDSAWRRGRTSQDHDGKARVLSGSATLS